MASVTLDSLTQKRAGLKSYQSMARCRRKKAFLAKPTPTRGQPFTTRTANRPAWPNNLSTLRSAMPDKKLSSKLDLSRSNRSEPDWHLAELVRSIKARRESVAAGFPSRKQSDVDFNVLSVCI